MSATPIAEAKNVPFNTIEIPEDENVRSKLEGIDELAEDIKQNGLITALTVTNGGSKDQPYRLDAGFRRAAALKKLKWGDKLVPVVIVTTHRAITNLRENIHRQDVHPADLAQRLHDLETGEFPGAAEGEKFTKKQLVEQLKMSLAHVTNLIRAHKNLGKDAKKAWRTKDVPLTIVFKWAAMDEAEQDKAVANWLKQEKDAKERAAAAKAKGGSGEGEGEGGGSEREATPVNVVKGAKLKYYTKKLNILRWKLDNGMVKGATEKAATEAEVMLLRHIVGEVVRFPSISKAEEKAYENWVAEQAAGEETEEDGEEDGDEE